MGNENSHSVELTVDEIEEIIFRREFLTWYGELSQSTRATLSKFPAEARLSIAKNAVSRRLDNEALQGVRITATPFYDFRQLIAS